MFDGVLVRSLNAVLDVWSRGLLEDTWSNGCGNVYKTFQCLRGKRWTVNGSVGAPVTARHFSLATHGGLCSVTMAKANELRHSVVIAIRTWCLMLLFVYCFVCTMFNLDFCFVNIVLFFFFCHCLFKPVSGLNLKMSQISQTLYSGGFFSKDNGSI